MTTPLEQPPEASPVDPAAQSPTTPKVLERPHPLTPVVKSWIGIVGISVYLGRDLLERLVRGEHVGSIDQWWWLIAVIGGIFALVTVFGFISWRTTRFVVDDDEVRIERNFINHTSDRIGFSKIQSVDVVQPFAARLLGLTSVKIDVGSGGGKEIAYLSRTRAVELRDFLLARAHRSDATVASTAVGPHAGILSDLSTADRVLVRATPRNLVITGLLSAELASLIFFGLLGFFVPLAITGKLYGAFGALPLLLSAAGMIGNRVIKQWNYTLADTGYGVRVTRGLTSLASQSLPVSRIQGIAIEQGILWRPFGLYRVKIDVLGQHGMKGESDVDSLLMPAGTWADVETALHAVWPGLPLQDVPLETVPSRARWLRWFDAQTLRWGCSDQVIVSQSGLLTTTTSVVHHARAQSVALRQGPWQRRLKLATVAVHTSSGPVDLRCRHLDEQVARELAMSELGRAAAARRARPTVPGQRTEQHHRDDQGRDPT